MTFLWRARAPLSLADGADEAAAFAAALEATISGATVDASEEDCTQLSRRRSLLQSTSAELDFTVTVSGSDAATATAASIESVVDAAISSGDFDTALDSAGLTLDVTVSGVSAVLPVPTPVPTAVPTPSPVAGKKKSKDKDDVNTALENPVAIAMLVIVLLLCFVAVMKYQPKKDEDDGKVKNPPYNVQDDIVAEDHPSMIEVLPEDRAYALGEIMEG